ncbi:hypothetical protein [Paenibacillus sp. VTT E-133291]|uniref:hypothetical protein n=1 Tax=Paenibacillus sp. VTT E-133291 TaxID=1986223 RepID=UPI000BA156B9|nr:hypothetical protein [Paenibacillus sp. VTT E-133291]OZQ97323.1 hypothetical protein CA598_05895 [Paenibacillus sp. VTT E-133291]
MMNEVNPYQPDRRRIISLREGEEITSFYLIKDISFNKTDATTNRPAAEYMTIHLMDETGELQAKVWGLSPKEKEDYENRYRKFRLLKVKALVQLYKPANKAPILQLKLIQHRLAERTDGYKRQEFVRSAPIQLDEVLVAIKERLQDVSDPVLRNIALFCYEKAGKKIIEFPAAKNLHHAYFGGLLYHKWRGLEAIEFYGEQRPFLNLDLMVTGWLIHDIAKVEELLVELGICSDYSRRGKLLGHIAIATLWISEACFHYGFDIYDHVVEDLMHVVLAHHNKAEHGSPVQPRLPEAVAIHYVDMMDSRLQGIEDAFMMMRPEEEWTPKLFMLENQSFYRGSISEEAEKPQQAPFAGPSDPIFGGVA